MHPPLLLFAPRPAPTRTCGWDTPGHSSLIPTLFCTVSLTHDGPEILYFRPRLPSIQQTHGHGKLPRHPGVILDSSISPSHSQDHTVSSASQASCELVLSSPRDCHCLVQVPFIPRGLHCPNLLAIPLTPRVSSTSRAFPSFFFQSHLPQRKSCLSPQHTNLLKVPICLQD